MSMTRESILLALQAGTIDIAAASAQLASLEKPAGQISLKVSEKGAVSVYGLGRWPVTLYREQWERFIPYVKSDAIGKFIAVNASKLSSKADKLAAEEAAKAKALAEGAKADAETDAEYAARKLAAAK